MDNRRGILLMTLAMFGFAVGDAFAKASARHVSPGEIILAVSIGGFLFCMALARFNNTVVWRREAIFHPVIMLRNLFEVVGVFGIISAFAYLDLSTVTAIQNASPLIATVYAVIFLSEKVGWRRWSAIVFGFLCILLIIRPGFSDASPLVLYALIGTLALAGRDVTTRAAPDDIPSIALSIYAYIAMFPAGIVLSYLQGGPSYGWSSFWPLIGLIGSSTIAYLLVTIATRMGDISAILPFRYSRLIFVLVIAVIFFGERPDTLTLLGAAGILASGIFLMKREARR